MKKNRNKTLSAPLPPAAPAKTSKKAGKQGKTNPPKRSQANSGKRQAMVSLPVRIAMGVLAVIFLIIAGVLLANMTAIDTYNQATASLNASVEYSKKPDADPQRLKAQLDQANAQFDQARRMGILLAPNTKELINVNSDISGKLTTSTKRKIASSEGNGNGTGGKGTKGKGSKSSNSGNGNNQGLTDEQRKQVEETLKANQPNGAVNGDKKTPTKSDEGTNVKPW
ncbi:MAG: cell surface protein [Bifidobacterium sp.]|nr:cell surface protein [Bifidobacterium sp.]